MSLEQRPFADPIAAAVANVLEGTDGRFSRSDREMMAWTEGLLTAAAIGPERTRPDEWAKAVFGPERKYENADEAQDSAAMLAVMHDTILNDLRRLGPDFSPFFLEHAADGEELALGGDWAAGFVAGTQLRSDAWEGLNRSEPGKLMLSVAMCLLTDRAGHSLFLEGDVETIRRARVDALGWLGLSVFEMAEYWKAHTRRAQRAAVDPFRKIGRNERCPCGSGKKHKKCCLYRAED